MDALKLATVFFTLDVVAAWRHVRHDSGTEIDPSGRSAGYVVREENVSIGFGLVAEHDFNGPTDIFAAARVANASDKRKFHDATSSESRAARNGSAIRANASSTISISPDRTGRSINATNASTAPQSRGAHGAMLETVDSVATIAVTRHTQQDEHDRVKLDATTRANEVEVGFQVKHRRFVYVFLIFGLVCVLGLIYGCWFAAAAFYNARAAKRWQLRSPGPQVDWSAPNGSLLMPHGKR